MNKGLIIFTLSFLYTGSLFAASLPGFASGGDFSGDLENKAETITNAVIAVAVIAGIIGIVVGGIKYSSGNADSGKQWLVNSLIGLFLSGSVYGIAALVIN